MGLEKGVKKIKEQEKHSHKSMGKTGHTISNTLSLPSFEVDCF